MSRIKDAVEIYTKIVVAFYGFVAPSFTILISIFLEGIEKRKAEHNEKVKEIGELIKIKISQTDANLIKVVEDGNKQLKKLSVQSKKQLNLLNPKRQILRIFIPLTVAALLDAAYQIELNTADLNIQWLKAISLGLSIMAFCYALYVIWQIFCIIIEVRIRLIEDKKSVLVTSN